MAVLMVLMMADSMVELLVLMMVVRKDDEKVPWMAESTVYWMVEWWAVGMDKKMVGMMA
jgi:hypothetical protein